MLDFTDGTTWFLCGLGVTALLVVLVAAFAMFARKVEPR